MLELDEHNCETYLREKGWIGAAERVDIQPLSGGVSNQVLFVARPDRTGEDFVLKQARPQLRVPDPWFCGVERIWREVEVLQICSQLLDSSDRGPALAARVPKILHEDREQFAFAMTAAPREHRVWRSDLLAGQASEPIASDCGRLLGRLHARSWQDETIAARLDDRTVFDQLRLDPYYRTVAQQDHNFAPVLEALIASVWSHRLSLVHADFSPKNLLVYPDGLMMVDFETGHYGDPAFDLGFFLSHLVLKAIHWAPDGRCFLALTERFWQAYGDELKGRVDASEYADLVARSIQNFAACAWARLDGKSRVDYLSNPEHRDSFRALCQQILTNPPTQWRSVLQLIEQKFQATA